jgi:hypothetical protein
VKHCRKVWNKCFDRIGTCEVQKKRLRRRLTEMQFWSTGEKILLLLVTMKVSNLEEKDLETERTRHYSDMWK